MYKCCFPLVLALAWIPDAYAFPPCPNRPIRLEPLARAEVDPSLATPFWYRGFYAFAGNPLVTGELAGGEEDIGTTNDIEADERSKCRDRVPVVLDNLSTGAISMWPAYPEGAGFGVVALPDLRYGTPDDLSVGYRLAFSVDDAPLAEPGEWLDLAQLEFRRNDADDPTSPHGVAPTTAIYRIRKAHSDKHGPVLHVIETRVPDGAGGDTLPTAQRIVATIALPQGQSHTPIALRWRQSVAGSRDKTPNDGGIVIGPPIPVKKNVDSHLEVLGREHKVLYSIALPGQWANGLSMGLLDYNVDDISRYDGRFGAEMIGTSLSVESF